jgi:hypothetical protein
MIREMQCGELVGLIGVVRENGHWFYKTRHTSMKAEKPIISTRKRNRGGGV